MPKVTKAFPEVSKYVEDGKGVMLAMMAEYGLLTDEEAKLWADECKLELVYIGEPEDENLAIICRPPRKYQ